MVTRFSQFLTGAESWLLNLASNAVSEGAAMFCSPEYTAMTDSSNTVIGKTGLRVGF